MRVVIADPELRAGRRLAAVIEQVAPAVDVLLYAEADDAVAGIREHHPDVVFLAPAVGDVAGPDLARRVADGDAPSIVGLVDAPDPVWSQRWTDAGASVVVARPVDPLGVRVALRHHAEGIPG